MKPSDAALAKIGRFTAQAWDGNLCVSSVENLSYDAARHVASSATLTGFTGRMIADEGDYCEVYCPDGSMRIGTLAETTLVRGGK
jgi:hypothetical protein